MQRGQDQVARLSGPYGHFSGFEITNLAHHDDVRVLAQERSQARREGQPYPWVDVYLVDAGEIDFRRIFRGSNVSIRGIEPVEAGIEGYCLAASRRSRDQDHPVRFGEVLQVDLFLFVLVTQRVDVCANGGGVQQPADDFLPEQGWAGVDTKVDGTVR